MNPGFAGRWGTGAVLACAVAACAGPLSLRPDVDPGLAVAEEENQRELYLRDWQDLMIRAQTVFSKLVLANADLCDNARTTYFGIQIQTAESYDAEFRASAVRVLGVGDLPTIVYVWPGSPADVGGLVAGDQIVRVDGALIGSGVTGRGNAVRALHESGAATGVGEVTVTRDNVERTVTINPVNACDYSLAVQRSDSINAYADGTRVVAASGLIRFATDDAQLALVLGHELAHAAMHHVERQSANAVAGGLLGALFAGPVGLFAAPASLGAFSQAYESEADYIGTYFAARAGYGVDGVADLWRQMAIRSPGTIHATGSTHPSSAVRFLAIEQTAREIAGKRAVTQSLVPNLKH